MKKKHHKKLWALIIVIVSYASFSVWDFYMRSSWDDYIISEEPSRYTILHKQNSDDIRYFGGAKLDGPRTTLSEKAIHDLSDQYKKKIVIARDGDKYILSSHNEQELKKQIRIQKPLLITSERPQVQKTFFDFKNKDESISISIAVDEYLHHSCQPFGREQNTIIKYDIDDGDRLEAYTKVNVYENIFQFLLCD